MSQYMEGKTFEDLKREVIDEDICTGCGTCASFCESIEMKEGIPTLVGECSITRGALKCGACYEQCPQTETPLPIEKFVSIEKSDALFGNYIDILGVKSKDPRILERAQDGGAVSEILKYSLSKGIVDCAVVSAREDGWKPFPKLITNPEEVLQGSGTKYCVSPNVSLIGEAVRSGMLRIAIVGTPCQIRGTRLMQEYLLKEIPKIEILTIGLFCSENYRYDDFSKFLEPILGKEGLTLKDVTKTEITKGMFILRNPKKDIEMKIAELDPITPKNCMRCIDFAAELADISVGSVGTPPGWSTIITRSERGDKLVKSMLEEDVFEKQEEINLKIIRLLAKKKKDRMEKGE
ncbi:MAG: Coenzyme F420 hydrogenase/dehydrogenase, beta subunit C-terminal domain [Candidatus Syntropharchaeia archaeon]